MEFSDFPLEIVYLIADSLELDSEISALSRTTRRLYNSLDSYLYQHNVRRYNSCALEWAALHGRASVTHKLLKAGAPPFATVYENMQPIWRLLMGTWMQMLSR
ncbi:hypothetical protein N7517_006541 [Penicillium concentricum]|uniref:F-box domain-containing protein n=1 Tax=Penicillium concentricum TaxID=293559 RepID=A0A9W9SAQ0_9EURO|nr:uncharacterized protein N7517_006541 [Penicillium concentricum]KAJ5374535.1 hypothetical protein N7517_006541 [Penicillium concentricum]